MQVLACQDQLAIQACQVDSFAAIQAATTSSTVAPFRSTSATIAP